MLKHLVDSLNHRDQLGSVGLAGLLSGFMIGQLSIFEGGSIYIVVVWLGGDQVSAE